LRVSLSPPQLRRVATALVERDACREQKGVVEAQFANCHTQVDTNAAIIRQQVDSLAKLNQALSAQDEIQARREAQQQTELKAARGSRLSRLARAVQWVAVGIVLGAVIR
jgi:DNA-directed RNA polymerase beta subunit